MIRLGIRSTIRKRLARARRRNIYSQVKDFTMMSEQTFCDNLALAEMAREVPGCVVECGVWRGGMSAGLCRVLGPDRDYFLLDSFEGLPPAQPIDGAAAIKYQLDTQSPNYYDNCTASSDFAQRAMRSVGATRVNLVAGYFNETLPGFDPNQPIALLRLDADWYESTIVCLRHLFEMVTPGGMIILDDYYTWDGCSRALHQFLCERSATERIGSFNGSVCYLIKNGPPQ